MSAEVAEDWEPGEPKKHIDEVIASHREDGRRGERVADKIEETLDLPYVPDFLRDHVAIYAGGLGYEMDDYVSIDKRNLDARVEAGADVLVTFGSFSRKGQKQLVAQGTVVEACDAKHEEMTVEIAGETVEIKGWQIKGVLRETAHEAAENRVRD